jgi:hypothetical protein
MESSTNRHDSKENLVIKNLCLLYLIINKYLIQSNTNGTRQPSSVKQPSSRLDRSLSRNKDENETHIIRSNTASSFTEQAKPDELASGFATMGLLNDDDMNKVIFVLSFVIE